MNIVILVCAVGGLVLAAIAPSFARRRRAQRYAERRKLLQLEADRAWLRTLENLRVERAERQARSSAPNCLS